MDRSTMYAADLYASAFAEDPLNEEAGKRHRCVVLQPGSSQSEMETLEGFLGRKLKFKAFFDELDHLKRGDSLGSGAHIFGHLDASQARLRNFKVLTKLEERFVF